MDRYVVAVRSARRGWNKGGTVCYGLESAMDLARREASHDSYCLVHKDDLKGEIVAVVTPGESGK